MKTNHRLILLAALASAFSLSCCNTDLRALAENLGATLNAQLNVPAATAAAPSSVAGKKIIMDSKAAQHSSGDYGVGNTIKWGPYTPCNGGIETTPTFTHGNTVTTDPNTDMYVTWTYTKISATTAKLTKSQHELFESYTLTFDSATTGTAEGGTADECSGFDNFKNIRFTIK